jgi:hypothetical protein
MSKFFLIRCTIERGGFSSERTFQIKTDEGQLIGTADVEHLRDQYKHKLSDDEPPLGTSIDGFVKCRLIRMIDKNSALVDLPSTDVAHVPADELLEAVC